MKKVISVLAAVAMACSLGITTFAAVDVPDTTAPDTTVNITPTSAEPMIAIDVSGVASVGARELLLISNDNKNPSGLYNRLTPDEEYSFRIYYNDTDAPVALNDPATGWIDNPVGIKELTGADLKDKGSVRVRTKKASSYIQNVKIKTNGRGDA